MLGGIGGRRMMTEDDMAGWHHRLDGREFECIPGVGDGQGGLACCNSLRNFVPAKQQETRRDRENKK